MRTNQRKKPTGLDVDVDVVDVVVEFVDAPAESALEPSRSALVCLTPDVRHSQTAQQRRQGETNDYGVWNRTDPPP